MWVSSKTFSETTRRAFASGKLDLYGERLAGIVRPVWDISDGCLNPVFRELNTGSFREVKVGDIRTNLAVANDRTDRRTLEMWVRCRRCANCLKLRSALWRHRARQEIAEAKRTWFGTITLGPSAHFAMASRARLRLRAQGVNFDKLDADEQFVERHRETGVELTKWLKRVRKQSGSALRILLVCERHKSGLPHYHVLVHEVSDVSCPKRILQGQWTLGFTNWKLVDKNQRRTAAYVAKYLAKEAIARVRASARYGSSTVLTECRKAEHSDHPPAQPSGGVFGGTDAVYHRLSECVPEALAAPWERRLSSAFPCLGARHSPRNLAIRRDPGESSDPGGDPDDPPEGLRPQAAEAGPPAD